MRNEKPVMIRVFFDTKFTGLSIDPLLISIGLDFLAAKFWFRNSMFSKIMLSGR